MRFWNPTKTTGDFGAHAASEKMVTVLAAPLPFLSQLEPPKSSVDATRRMQSYYQLHEGSTKIKAVQTRYSTTNMELEAR